MTLSHGHFANYAHLTLTLNLNLNLNLALALTQTLIGIDILAFRQLYAASLPEHSLSDFFTCAKRLSYVSKWHAVTVPDVPSQALTLSRPLALPILV